MINIDNSVVDSLSDNQFPMSSVRCVELINELRKRFNGSAKELLHKDFMRRVQRYIGGGNFTPSPLTYSTDSDGLELSTYTTSQGKTLPCYLMSINKVRTFAAYESIHIASDLMDYLAALEEASKKRAQRDTDTLRRKGEGHGIPLMDVAKSAGLPYQKLAALLYLNKRNSKHEYGPFKAAIGTDARGVTNAGNSSVTLSDGTEIKLKDCFKTLHSRSHYSMSGGLPFRITWAGYQWLTDPLWIERFKDALSFVHDNTKERFERMRIRGDAFWHHAKLDF